jgi:hypothetical protein
MTFHFFRVTKIYQVSLKGTLCNPNSGRKANTSSESPDTDDGDHVVGESNIEWAWDLDT